MDNLTAVESIFFAALERPSPEERAAYLDGACGSDAELRGRVERLLSVRPKLGDFLRAPAPGLTEDEPPGAEVPGTKVGPYKLLQRIGEGGMGVVWMAEQEEPVRRRVALKVIKPGMDSRQVIARFEAERQALALMDHANIARVLDAGTTEAGRPYFVMELVHGVPITRYCDDNRLTPRERLGLFVPVCRAIQHAHQKGIIHRDVKPSNVLVTMYDDKPVPKVIDFGVAKAVEQRLTDKTLFTRFGALVGTFEYMSPEQAEMNALGVDTRSDVYSLGVLLYELLTGTTPLDQARVREAALDELVRLIREEEPPRPSVRLSSSDALPGIAAARRTEPARLPRLVRGELDWIVMRCLEKDRSRRYESPGGLALDVERYLADEPVEACPPSAAYRLAKFVRKNRTVVVLGTAIAMMLLVGIVGIGVSAVAAYRARMAAMAERDRAEASKREAEGARRAAERRRGEAARANENLSQTTDDLRRTLYAAHMNLAHNAWNAPGGVALARDLLDRHRPRPGEPDPRGFEWHYLNRLCHTELLTFGGHTGVVYDVGLSRDGLRLATSSADGTLRVWDFRTGRQLLCCGGRDDPLAFVGFGRGDRTLVVLAGLSVAVLDARTGKEAWRRAADPEQVLCHALSPDRKRLATGGKDRTVKVWDLETDKELLTLKGHQGWVSDVRFGPDGQRLASASYDDGTVRVWDARDGRELLTLRGAGRRIAFSPDGSRLASADRDRAVKVWDAGRGRELFTVRGTGPAGFSPDGRLLATTTPDGVSVWDARTGAAKCSRPGHIIPWDFSPDGRRLVTGGPDRTVRVWDGETGREILAHRGHADAVSDVSFTPDGRRLVSAAFDGTVKVWDAERSAEPVRVRKGLVEAHAVAFSPDGSLVAYDSTREQGNSRAAGDVWLEDVRTGREKLTFRGHETPVADLVFSPDGRRLASAGDDQTVKVWDVSTGREVFTLREDGRNGGIGIGAVVFSPDGRHLASVSSYRKVTVWDARTGQRSLTLDKHAGWVDALAYSPDGSRLACACAGKVHLWDAETGREALTVEWPAASVGRNITSLAASPDGRVLACGGAWGAVRLCDAGTGRELRTLPGHTGPVHRLAFGPDGRRLASASEDGTVKLWDVATGHEVLTLRGTAPFSGVAFSPDGTRLAACGGDELRVWDGTPLPEERAAAEGKR